MRHGITDDIIEVIDEIKYEELIGSADAAAEIQRNDHVRLAQAFADIAATSDSVLKLQRYESAIFRRRNDLRHALGSLQRVRMNADMAEAEPNPPNASSA
jgi:fumarate hydratase class II